MSVINKMLRDLDQRQAGPGAEGAGGASAWTGATVALDRASVGEPAAAARKGRVWIGVAAVAVLATAFGGFWLQQVPPVPQHPGVAPGVAVPVVAVPPSAVQGVSAPASAASTDPAPQRAASVEPETVQLRLEPQLSAQNALDALLSTPPPPPLRTKPAASAAAVVDTPKTEVVRPAATPRTAGASLGARPEAAAVASAPLAARRTQLAGNEALAQAQTLWSGGSADAAIEVVAAALGVAERNVRAGSEAVGNPQLLTLAREWTRMQLASGRYGVVWEELTRLEPVLGPVPDLLALRANAAQRIGRHQDSVQSYLAALQLRPEEQRWLLGAAVSLAAMGQTTSAAELVEKARALGPVNKSIAAYLRQAGVALHD